MVLATGSYEFFLQMMIAAAASDEPEQAQTAEGQGLALREAAEEGDLEQLRRLLADGADQHVRIAFSQQHAAYNHTASKCNKGNKQLTQI